MTNLKLTYLIICNLGTLAGATKPKSEVQQCVDDCHAKKIKLTEQATTVCIEKMTSKKEASKKQTNKDIYDKSIGLCKRHLETLSQSEEPKQQLQPPLGSMKLTPEEEKNEVLKAMMACASRVKPWAILTDITATESCLKDLAAGLEKIKGDDIRRPALKRIRVMMQDHYNQLKAKTPVSGQTSQELNKPIKTELPKAMKANPVSLNKSLQQPRPDQLRKKLRVFEDTPEIRQTAEEFQRQHLCELSCKGYGSQSIHYPNYDPKTMTKGAVGPLWITLTEKEAEQCIKELEHALPFQKDNLYRQRVTNTAIDNCYAHIHIAREKTDREEERLTRMQLAGPCIVSCQGYINHPFSPYIEEGSLEVKKGAPMYAGRDLYTDGSFSKAAMEAHHDKTRTLNINLSAEETQTCLAKLNFADEPEFGPSRWGKVIDVARGQCGRHLFELRKINFELRKKNRQLMSKKQQETAEEKALEEFLDYLKSTSEGQIAKNKEKEDREKNNTSESGSGSDLESGSESDDDDQDISF